MSSAAADTPILDLLGRMTADSMETSTLDEQTLMLVRVAALDRRRRPAGVLPPEPRRRR